MRPARVLLLGASNVRRGLPAAVETARAAWGPGLEIFGAFGHGRSYGVRSSFLARELPGILDCGVWEALEGAGSAPVAVVTDVGNDILYGHSPPTILEWVGACVSRLQGAGAAVRLTTLPLERIRQISRREFLLFRTLFFPGSRVAWREAIGRSEQVDAGLRTLAARAEAAFVEPDAAWYGADPIHIRRVAIAAAWGRILGSPAAPPMPRPEAIRLLLAAPERRWICGIERRHAQPALVRRDGTRIFLY